MTCPYKNTCEAFYAEHLDCSKMCYLAQQLKSNNVNDFVMSLLKKEDKDTELHNRLREVSCPRAMLTDVKISKPCVINTCPFYTKKLSYNCNLIHQYAFFKDYYNTPKKLLEISTNLHSKDYLKLLESAIYSIRARLITVNYAVINNKMKLPDKKSQRAVGLNLHNYCAICGVITEDCSCLKDKSLRIKRVLFNKRWKTLFENEIIAYGSPEDLATRNKDKLHNLQFIRGILAKVEVANVKFSDIPFGYILSLYSKMFTDKDCAVSQNLGIRETLFEKACVLFKEG